MKPPDSFLWHDYETFGTDAALDRPAQFAALRTDAELEALGEPVCFHCAPADDYLPHPAACLVTGITPQEARHRGEREADFAARIEALMAVPGTCVAGYNSLRFDDEFTRHLLYRNFFDPYAREYRNGNTRWDLLDLMRMCYALRPDGLHWPEHEPGTPSFRLEDLTAANGIEHGDAHDALGDVRATLALARRLRAANPRLFAWGLELRDQQRVLDLLNPLDPQALVHTSGRFPAHRGCTTLVLPLATMPGRRKSVIVCDLMADPEPLLSLPPDAIEDRVFTATADLPEGVERIALKAVHANKVPMLAPEAVLRGVDLERIGLDPERCARHARALRAVLPEIRRKVCAVYDRPAGDIPVDPELQLYRGGFLSDRDRRTLDRLRSTPPTDLGDRDWGFEDARLPEMLFRYRARNHPETLSADEAQRWERDRQRRLLEPAESGRLTLARYHEEISFWRQQREGQGAALRVLDALEAWPLELGLPDPGSPPTDAMTQT